MLNNQPDVDKIIGGLEKLTDAVEKFCVVRLSEHTSKLDVVKIVEGLDFMARGKQLISLILPPMPEE